MPEKCDRCIQWGGVEWWKPEGWLRLFMCDHHSRQYASTLFDTGWACHINSDVWGVEPEVVA